MAIKFKLCPDGAFVAGDTDTGRTAYAYQSSPHAELAKRSPAKVAERMVTSENAMGVYRDSFDDFDLRNWARINA